MVIVVVTDCNCHKTHAYRGCTHPNMVYEWRDVGRSYQDDGTLWSEGASLLQNGGSGEGGSSSGGNTTIPTVSVRPDGSSALPDFLINIIGTNTLSDQQINWIENPNNINAVETLLYQISLNGSTNINKDVAAQLIHGTLLNPNFKFDIVASFKSPMNIDRDAINNNTPEGAKFNEIYDALITSPEFKKLFIDIFDSNTRPNVKFKIVEHVYEDNNPSKKEVNATTSQDPVTKSLTIRISKQILTGGTGIIKGQTKIENAKTILHECIHAYLFAKSNNPSVGMDIAEMLNTIYPTPNEQHNFMADKMIPIMQKVLGEIRDLVTTAAGRAEVVDLKIYTKIDLSAFEIWNWTNYYKCISVKGLEETSCYKVDFPKDSNELFFLSRYLIGGQTYLDKK